MRSLNIHTRGFSLLELLVYIGVFSILVTAVGSSFYSFMRVEARAESSALVDEALRFVSETVTRDIERASVISVPSSGVASSSLVLIRDGKQISYTIDDGIYMRQEGVNNPEALTPRTVQFTSAIFMRIENYQSVRVATSTSVRWELYAKHRNEAPEYAYESFKEGAVELRVK